jgi:hypothetical protein
MPDTQYQETRRVLLAEAGEWARHYSNVRMTVITFVVTACVAILALKWDADIEKKPSSQAQAQVATTHPPATEATKEKEIRAKVVANSVALLWILGALVFQGFTYYSLRRMAAELKHRRHLLVEGEKLDEIPSYPGFDWPSLTITAVSLVLTYCLAATTAGVLMWRPFEVFIYILVGESIVLPLYFWVSFWPPKAEKGKAQDGSGGPSAII